MSFDCVEREPTVACVSAEIEQNIAATLLHGCPLHAIFDKAVAAAGSSWTLQCESVEQGRQDSGDYPLLGAVLSLLERPIPSPIITVPQTKAVLRIKSTLCQFLPPNCPEEAPYLSETNETSSK